MSEINPRTTGIPESFQVSAHEILVGGERQIHWEPGPHDDDLAAAAGWEKYQVRRGDLRYLNVPSGTRRASTVLSGSEAYAGEHQKIIEFALGYVQAIAANFEGAVDTGVTFDHLAVTRGEEPDYFITPPHVLTRDPQQIHRWARTLVEDAAQITSDNPELANQLAARLDETFQLGDHA